MLHCLLTCRRKPSAGGEIRRLARRCGPHCQYRQQPSTCRCARLFPRNRPRQPPLPWIRRHGQRLRYCEERQILRLPPYRQWRHLRRPCRRLSARFGAAATVALDRLLGRADSRITALRPLPALHFARRFAEPIGHAESIRAALASLALEAIAELDRRGEGGRCFAAAFFRSDGAVRELAIETGQPTRDPALIARLFHERIEGLADPLDPGFGFDLIRFAVPATEALGVSQGDLHSRPQQGEAFDALIDRLSIRHGRGRIQRITPVDTHVPERAERASPAQDTAPGIWPLPPPGEPPLRPIFLFDPPQPLEVLAEVPDAPPRRFRWKGVTHVVVRAEGPERIAAPWWTKSGEGRPTRDYYRVEDSEGRRFWLYRHGLYGCEADNPRWFLHGLFA